MNVKEKLDVFTRNVMGEAEEKRQQMMLEIEQTLADAKQNAEKTAKQKSADTIKKEKSRIELVKNREVLDATAASKRELIALRNELVEKLTVNVTEKLDEWAKTGEYADYISQVVREAVAAHGDMDVYLTIRDMAHADAIKAIISGDVKASSEDFLGGFRAIVQHGHGLLDYSFKTRLEEEIRKFNQFKITG